MCRNELSLVLFKVFFNLVKNSMQEGVRDQIRWVSRQELMKELSAQTWTFNQVQDSGDP